MPYIIYGITSDNHHEILAHVNGPLNYRQWLIDNAEALRNSIYTHIDPILITRDQIENEYLNRRLPCHEHPF